MFGKNLKSKPETMTHDEQVKICMAIAAACMWGQGGIASVIIDNLQGKFPMAQAWGDVFAANKSQAKYEAVGVITEEEELNRYIDRGYRLVNYRPNELSLHYPPPMGGLSKYVLGDLAEKYGKLYDSHNYNIYQKCAAARLAG